MIDLGAAPMCRRGQTRGVVRGNGPRWVTIKTLHGALTCVAQRFQGPSRWYHLDNKVGELMGMAARTKQEKADHGAPLLDHLWHGRTAAALLHLQRAVQAKNPAPLVAWMTYREKHRAESIDDGRRQRAGQPIGSGRMEQGGAQVIGVRQQHKGMRWSSTGSKALGSLKVVELNQQWAQLWFPQQAAA